MGTRLLPALVAVTLVLGAACASDDLGPAGGPGAGEAKGIEVPQVPTGSIEDVPSAVDDPTDQRLPTPLIDPSEMPSGGPPPDGIPAIDRPRFLPAEEVRFLADNEPVLALEVDGEARAYPVQVMVWHEIVNDTVGGVPVAVSYCPLCNSALTYDRRVEGRVLSFGTSGRLYNSSLVMYDRQTRSLWSHFTAQSVAGVLTGTPLDTFPVATVSWADWRDAHPDGLVLTRETGFDRSYGENPYPGYDDVDDPPFAYEGPVDERLAAKERVVGLGATEAPVAVHLDVLRREGVVSVDIGEREVIVWELDGTASALDETTVAGGRDVGAVGAFSPVLDGRPLRFDRRDGAFQDRETGSRWNVLGQATSGTLSGRSLEPVEHVDTFWFAWAAFQPDTRLVR